MAETVDVFCPHGYLHHCPICDNRASDDDCGCCEVNDFDPLPDMDTACAVCGHAIEEHDDA